MRLKNLDSKIDSLTFSHDNNETLTSSVNVRRLPPIVNTLSIFASFTPVNLFYHHLKVIFVTVPNESLFII